MAGYLKGDVVLAEVIFTDLSQSITRPAYIVANLTGDDLILCQITKRKCSDKYCIGINKSNFTSGGLRLDSTIRPNKIFTVENSLIDKKIGHLEDSVVNEVTQKLIEIIKAGN